MRRNAAGGLFTKPSKLKLAGYGIIPDHQEGIRCKAPRSDDWGVWSNTPQGGAIEGNAADDALMVDQGLEGYPLGGYSQLLLGERLGEWEITNVIEFLLIGC